MKKLLLSILFVSAISTSTFAWADRSHNSDSPDQDTCGSVADILHILKEHNYTPLVLGSAKNKPSIMIFTNDEGKFIVEMPAHSENGDVGLCMLTGGDNINIVEAKADKKDDKTKE